MSAAASQADRLNRDAHIWQKRHIVSRFPTLVISGPCLSGLRTAQGQLGAACGFAVGSPLRQQVPGSFISGAGALA